MVQSNGPLKNVLSVFKRGSSHKTPGKYGSPSKAEAVASPLTKRLFSFSPSKAAHGTPGAAKRAPPQDAPEDLIPVGTLGIASAAQRVALSSAGDNSNIRVVVRVRPRNGREASLGGAICVQPVSDSSLRLNAPSEPPHTFSFDHVAAEGSSQEDVFEMAGRPVVESCLAGFNGCLLAYGQTGSGKTYSMLGADEAGPVIPDDHRRGLIQRIFEHLFAALAAAQVSRGEVEVV